MYKQPTAQHVSHMPLETIIRNYSQYSSFTTQHSMAHNNSMKALNANTQKRHKTPNIHRPATSLQSNNGSTRNNQKPNAVCNMSLITNSNNDLLIKEDKNLPKSNSKSYNIALRDRVIDNRTKELKENIKDVTPGKHCNSGMALIDELIEYAQNTLNDSKCGKPLYLSTPDSPKCPLNINKQADQNLALESKWKKFGLLMADSYEDLKKKYKVSLESITKNQQIVNELKGQIDKLKKLLQISKDENESLSKKYKDVDSLKQQCHELTSKLFEKDNSLRQKDQEIQNIKFQLSSANAQLEQMKMKCKVY